MGNKRAPGLAMVSPFPCPRWGMEHS
jgi:hypothetical protein